MGLEPLSLDAKEMAKTIAAMTEEAERDFDGPVAVAEDLAEFEN